MKKCSLCKIEKEDSEFYTNNSIADGLTVQCRECRFKYYWEHLLFHKFGITGAQYELMLKLQKDVCVICGQPETAKLNGKVLRLSVDHDYKTFKIRGLLCHDCNVGLGHFKNDPGLLGKAQKYLEQANANNST